MKIRYKILIALSPIVIFTGFLLITHLTYPDGWKPGVRKSKDKISLTQKELKEDLDYLKYYIKNAYIGYDQLVENGFDIDAVLNEVYENSWTNKDGTNRVASTELNGQLRKSFLKSFCISDGHFGIGGWYPEASSKIYWSDVLIKKQNDEYKILKYDLNDDEEKKEPLPQGIISGAKYTGSEANLYPYYDGDELVYRYGIYTKNNINKATISVENQNIYIPVWLDKSILTGNLWQSLRTTDETLYFSFADFMFSSKDNTGSKQFEALSKKIKENVNGKKNIIIDLRNNGGGEGVRATYLISNLLYTNDENYKKVTSFLMEKVDGQAIRLISPPVSYKYRKIYLKYMFEEAKKAKIKKENPQTFEFDEFNENIYENFEKNTRKYMIQDLFIPKRRLLPAEYILEKETELPEPDFSGNIYILTNNYSASCSEYTLAFFKLIEKEYPEKIKVFQLGQNTNGAVSYYNPFVFSLPNSGISTYFPTAYSPPFEDPQFKGECQGWHPDFWTPNQNIKNTLIQLTLDQALEEVLSGLEKKQL